MSFVKIWVHAVWGTKNRIPYFSNDLKNELIFHIRENAKNKNIYIDFINGYKDHLHCLISLNAKQTIAEVMQQIKGESSHWLNKNNLTAEKFAWAEEYFVVSVSESQIHKVREYIKNQEDHHRKKTWTEEYNEFISKYNFVKIAG